METHFPEIFSEYERLDVDCVLFSTTGGAPDDGTFATETQAHASTNRYWTSFSVPAQHSPISPAGVIAPDGRWAARCPQDGTPAVAVADIESGTETVSALSRPWRRTARAGLYDRYLVQQDVRSDDRSVF